MQEIVAPGNASWFVDIYGALAALVSQIMAVLT
jgi:hypothetical protein